MTHLVRAVVELRVAAIVGVGTQAALVLDLAGAVAQVERDLLVLRPDLVSVAPPSRIAAGILLRDSGTRQVMVRLVPLAQRVGVCVGDKRCREGVSCWLAWRLRTHIMPTVMASRSFVGSAEDTTMSTTWYRHPIVGYTGGGGVSTR